MVVGFRPETEDTAEAAETIETVEEGVNAVRIELSEEDEAVLNFSENGLPLITIDHIWTANEVERLETLLQTNQLYGFLKYFNMFFLRYKLSYALKKSVTVDAIWKYVETNHPEYELLDHVDENPFERLREALLTLPEAIGFEEMSSFLINLERGRGEFII